MRGDAPKNQFSRPGVNLDATGKRVWGMVLWSSLRIGDTVADAGIIRDIIEVEDPQGLMPPHRQYVFDHRLTTPLKDAEVFAFVSVDA